MLHVWVHHHVTIMLITLWGADGWVEQKSTMGAGQFNLGRDQVRRSEED